MSNARLALVSVFCLATASCGVPVVRPPQGGDGDGTGGRTGAGTGGSNGSGGSGGSSSPADGGLQLPDSGPVAPPPDAMPSADTNCGLRKVELKSKPGQALLLLDRSGSMAQRLVQGDPTSPVKWDETVGALDVAIDKTDEAVSWGIKIYPVDGVCGVRDGVEVPVAVANHPAIMTAIRANKPVENGGATPTQQAVRKALAFVKSQPALTDAYLVIATDGLPNCAAGASDTTPDAAGAVAAVAEARAAGLRSFVVGIATADTDAHATLNLMAEAGGFPRNDPTKYFSVSKRDDIAAAFQTITGVIASCVFPLDPPPPVPDNVAVEIDGRRLSKDPSGANGWQYGPGGNSILLVGAACDQIKAAPKSDVQILYGCPAQPIP